MEALIATRQKTGYMLNFGQRENVLILPRGIPT
jgi:hypothetical protein